MAAQCVSCGAPVEPGDYILVGVEQGSWESRYAHRGSCAAEARARYAPPKPRAKRRAAAKEVEPPAPVIEELTFEDLDPFPDDDLPWFGAERRR